MNAESTYHTMKLLECPFCGGEAMLFILKPDQLEKEIRCRECRIVMSNRFVPDLLKAWNTRLTSPKGALL